ncbi:RloB-like protein [Paenisporosarcina quisquiliarum]|nr:RloB-like protein [Paenisporosarcina quisquiliarum]
MALPSRKKRNLTTNQDIYIFTEGKETEVIYLDRIKQLLRVPTVKIKVRGVGQSSSNLVDYADKFVSRKNNIKAVWVVFDKDDLTNKQIQDAYSDAKSKNINIAFSNINFEIWLLLHFEKLNFPTPFIKNTVYSKLEKHLNIKDYEKKHKSDVRLIQDIADNYRIAISNNENLLLKTKSPLNTPYTNIVSLINFLST